MLVQAQLPRDVFDCAVMIAATIILRISAASLSSQVISSSLTTFDRSASRSQYSVSLDSFREMLSFEM